MRYRRALNKEQVQYLVEHADTPNKELAHKLNTRASVVATYKSRARKRGLELPPTKLAYQSTLDRDIIEAIKLLKKTKKDK